MGNDFLVRITTLISGGHFRFISSFPVSCNCNEIDAGQWTEELPMPTSFKIHFDAEYTEWQNLNMHNIARNLTRFLLEIRKQLMSVSHQHI
jgi:hypothetical protein